MSLGEREGRCSDDIGVCTARAAPGGTVRDIALIRASVHSEWAENPSKEEP
jgi:hypothetical protein